jgi:hypothetical protein
MRRSVTALAVGLGLAGLPAPAPAALVTYTFEGPQFLPGQPTPLPNRAPNVGDPTFLTSFTAAPNAAGFMIQPGGFGPTISGQFLIEPVVPADDLVLTFSAPVDSLSVVFVTNSPVTAPGRLELTTPVGVASVTGANLGGGFVFTGATLTFSSPTPFTTATLRAFNAAGGRIEFAIDNLTLNTATAAVPEPASLTLIGAGLVGAVARRRLRRA